MFTPGRYVVVDDELAELRILVETLHGIGAPCLGVHYTGHPLDPARFAGVRVLFCDLHLIPGANDHAQYSAVEALLRTNVNPAVSGPYILVIWTKHEEKLAELRSYLKERLDPTKKPIAILALDKAQYLTNGALAKPNELADAIADRISDSPQLRALMNWEADVLAAAGTTLAELGELVPTDETTGLSFSEKLDGVMSRLAAAAVGAPNVANNRRGALNAALAPILADRIVNALPKPLEPDVWDKAITRQHNLPSIDDAQTGRINRILHLSLPPAEVVISTDWGAVLLIPESERTDDNMLCRFGMKYQELLSQIFHIERQDRARCKPVVVRIGAICDYAQRRPGPLPYVVGVLVPTNIKRKNLARLKSEIESPIFVINEEDGPVRLYTNARFQISMTKPPEGWLPLFRIREQALMMIATQVGEYVTRPGIVQLPI